ncbi:hypothetical protein ACLKM7_03635 [Microbacterium sp. I2]|uniref:hypothetical protein n=1 Tax=Microbacterium sp. I2 TaxID=3391826 RepID=UPI003EDB3D9E
MTVPPPTDELTSHAAASPDSRGRGHGPIGAGRALAAIALAAVVLSIGFWICAWQVFTALFSGGWPVLPVLIVGFVALALIVIVLRLLTHRLRFGAALVAVLSALAVLIAGVMRTGGWGVLLGLQNGVVLIALGVVCALTLGVFFGPRWLRILGGGALLLVVAFAAAPWSYTQADAEPDPSVASEAAFDDVIEISQPPVVPDGPNDVVGALEPAQWSTVAWVSTHDGAALTVKASGGNTATDDPALPCGLMLEPTGGFEAPITIEDFGGECVRDGAHWVTSDGTARALWLGDVLVVLRSADPVALAEVGSTRAAGPDDLAAAAARLRTLSAAEFREIYRPQWDAAHNPSEL